jgi:DNA-directed RNA polymerase subunit RPC12/RpoP
MTCRHTPCPKGYVDWHLWAERKSKTYEQVRCPNCGLWAIWRRRSGG